MVAGFNSQPPEGGCAKLQEKISDLFIVSTHSRPKAAAGVIRSSYWLYYVSTHSRPKAAANGGLMSFGDNLFQLTAARRRLLVQDERRQQIYNVSTHSRPKAAAPSGTDAKPQH